MRNRPRHSWRIYALAGFFLLATGGLVARLAYIQLINHDFYREQANAEHFDRREVRTTRGAILDRNGFPLATSGGWAHLPHRDVPMPWAQDAQERPVPGGGSCAARWVID